MKRSLVMLGYGLGGILVALGLSLGAFALAGRQIGEPATPVRPAFSLTASPTPSEGTTPTPSPEPNETPTSSSSHDGSGPGDGSGSGDDHPGGGHPGSDD